MKERPPAPPAKAEVARGAEGNDGASAAPMTERKFIVPAGFKTAESPGRLITVDLSGLKFDTRRVGVRAGEVRSRRQAAWSRKPRRHASLRRASSGDLAFCRSIPKQ